MEDLNRLFYPLIDSGIFLNRDIELNLMHNGTLFFVLYAYDLFLKMLTGFMKFLLRHKISKDKQNLLPTNLPT